MSRNLGLEGLEDLLKKIIHDKKDDKKDSIKDLLKKLPPNYPVGGLYLNGVFVDTTTFSNLCDHLAYFTDEEGQVTVIDAKKVDGVAFGEVDAGE